MYSHVLFPSYTSITGQENEEHVNQLGTVEDNTQSDSPFIDQEAPTSASKAGKVNIFYCTSLYDLQHIRQ